jgi:hypothetical protein
MPQRFLDLRNGGGDGAAFTTMPPWTRCTIPRSSAKSAIRSTTLFPVPRTAGRARIGVQGAAPPFAGHDR